MSRDRRQQQRRQRNIERQSQRRAGRSAPVSYERSTDVEFPGIMGWMQRYARWIVLAGITLLVASLGAGSVFGVSGGIVPQPTATPADTPAATGTAPPPEDPTPTPDPSIQREYATPPELAIDPERAYEAVIHLEGGGEVRLALLPEAAPEYVNNFVFLARNRFYEGLTFHRVLPGFVAQGGDPLGTGFGGPGYTLPAEEN
ncbi:MAG: peptidylprolyl isomerase, partial [Dehalococcoidia bacterium]